MNNSTEVQFNSSPSGCSTIASTMFTLTLSLISTAALIGNVLVTTTFIKTPSLRTSTNYYIVNMAVSDLLGPLFNWPLYVSEGMLTPNIFINEPWASPVCKLGMYFRVVSQAVSVLSLMLIALDRFVAIVYPLKAIKMDNKKIRVIFLSLSWLISIVGSLPYALFAKIIKEEEQTFCRLLMNDGSWTVYNGVGFVCVYLFPLITIIVLYSAIMKALKRRPRPGNLLKAQENVKRRQQNQGVVKILISIVFAFLNCWTPLSVYVLLKKIYPSLFAKDRCLLLVGFSFYVCPSLSTAINPVILFVFSTNYNQALKSLCSQVFSTCRRGLKLSKPKKRNVMATKEVDLAMTDTKL